MAKLFLDSVSEDVQIRCSATVEEEEVMAAKAVCAAFIADDGCQYSLHVAKQLLKTGNQEAHDSVQQAIDISTQLLAMHAPSHATQGKQSLSTQ